MMLDEAMEFFNIVLGTGLTSDEKKNLVAYLYTL
jgi:hypothetical protein